MGMREREPGLSHVSHSGDVGEATDLTRDLESSLHGGQERKFSYEASDWILRDAIKSQAAAEAESSRNSEISDSLGPGETSLSILRRVAERMGFTEYLDQSVGRYDAANLTPEQQWQDIEKCGAKLTLKASADNYIIWLTPQLEKEGFRIFQSGPADQIDHYRIVSGKRWHDFLLSPWNPLRGAALAYRSAAYFNFSERGDRVQLSLTISDPRLTHVLGNIVRKHDKLGKAGVEVSIETAYSPEAGSRISK